MGRYPHLVLHRRRWMVRMIVPADVRSLLGQSMLKISTRETDEHRAVAKAGPIMPAVAQFYDALFAAMGAGPGAEDARGRLNMGGSTARSQW